MSTAMFSELERAHDDGTFISLLDRIRCFGGGLPFTAAHFPRKPQRSLPQRDFPQLNQNLTMKLRRSCSSSVRA